MTDMAILIQLPQPQYVFDLSDTGFIKRNIEYDPITKQYYVVEKIGDKYYRIPANFTMEEFVKIKGRKMKKNISENVQPC